MFDIPSRPDLDDVVERMAALIRPALSEPAKISRFGPMWEGDSWSLTVELITDRQLESLLKRDDILAEILTIASGLDHKIKSRSEFGGVSVSTQEYVDREYDGNWYGVYHNGGKPWN